MSRNKQNRELESKQIIVDNQCQYEFVKEKKLEEVAKTILSHHLDVFKELAN